jgi:hypothetical protein
MVVLRIWFGLSHIYMFGKDKYEKYQLKNEGQITIGTFNGSGSYINNQGTRVVTYSFYVKDSLISGSYTHSDTKAIKNGPISVIYWSQVRLKPRNFIAASLENSRFKEWRTIIGTTAIPFRG